MALSAQRTGAHPTQDIPTQDIRTLAATLAGTDIRSQSNALMRALVLASALMLGACVQEPELPKAWARADGRPVVSALLDIATLDCKDEMQKPDGASDPDKGADRRGPVDHYVGCMREHGYVQLKS
jgi:hypothetical protein